MLLLTCNILTNVSIHWLLPNDPLLVPKHAVYIDIVFFFKYDYMDSELINFFMTSTVFSQCCLHLVCIRFYIVNPVVTPWFDTSCEMYFLKFSSKCIA